MISTNDTTILSMLSRYPDMPEDEADGYISKIEHEENIEICYAVIGRTSREQLTAGAKNIFDEFYNWSHVRTQRIRDEQLTARRRQQETRLALRMNELHKQGVISDELMIIYGISGDLPDYKTYVEMTQEEKQSVWEEKMENRLGLNWRQRFPNMISQNTRTAPRQMNSFFRINRKKIAYNKINWLKEGF